MGRINAGSGRQAIGREGLIAFVQELNQLRASYGIKTRYRTVMRGGILHMDGPN